MIMCVLLCYPVPFHMLQLLLTGRPISSFILLSTSNVTVCLYLLISYQSLLQPISLLC